MKTLLGWVIVILIIVIGINQLKVWLESTAIEDQATGKKYDVLDGLTGNMAVDKFVDIRDKRDTFNLPAFKTSLIMFYTQNNHYPRTMEEFERSGDVSRDITHDHYGNRYELKWESNNTAILSSPGKDRIRGSTDDVEYRIQM